MNKRNLRKKMLQGKLVYHTNSRLLNQEVEKDELRIQRIREADNTTLQRLIEIDRHSFNSAYSSSLWRDYIRNADVYVAIYNQQIIGFSIINPHSNNYDYPLHVKIATLPQQRKNNIANILFEYILSRYSAIVANIRSHNIASINLHKKYGFKQIDYIQGYYSNGDDAVRVCNARQYMNQNFKIKENQIIE